MIIALRPPGMGRHQFTRYCHHWLKLGELSKEALIALDWTDWDIKSEWDRINQTPGRVVIWTTPNFFPRTNFFNELDYFLGEDVRVVTLREYEALYQPGAELPALRPGGICRFPIAFQLGGQTKFQLPRFNQLPHGYVKWLVKAPRPTVATMDQYFVGDGRVPILRSALGDVLPDCWDGRLKIFGRVISGGERVFQAEDIREYWEERMEGCEQWHVTMSGFKLSASEGLAGWRQP